MEQAGAQAALAPFLALAKSATSPRAAADLITQATSAQGTYTFAELLTHKNIDSLRKDSQYASYHRLLEIFAWETWETYRSTPNLPQLSDAQKLKLRLLSLISIASEKNGDLSYATLCKRLEFGSAIDLEHLVTSAIYFDLVAATLDPTEQIVVISSVAPLRDLAPGSVQNMLADLAAWSSRCDNVLAELEAEIAKVKSDAAKRAAQQSRLDKQVKAALSTSDKSQNVLGGKHGENRQARTSIKRDAQEKDNEHDDDDPMDLDEQTSGPRKKSGGPLDKLKRK